MRRSRLVDLFITCGVAKATIATRFIEFVIDRLLRIHIARIGRLRAQNRLVNTGGVARCAKALRIGEAVAAGPGAAIGAGSGVYGWLRSFVTSTSATAGAQDQGAQ